MIKTTIIALYCIASVVAFHMSSFFSDDLQRLQSFAEQGDVVAMHNLGLLYYQGNKVERDYKKAAAFYREAAIRGYVPAQYDLAALCHAGLGVCRDDQEAMTWWKKSALQNDQLSQRQIAIMYALGQGVQKNPALANFWMRKSFDATIQSNKTDE